MNGSGPDQDIASVVKEQTDIVKIIGEYVDLKRSGARYLGLCPFHGENTPSFSVNGAQQFYYCFGCGASGDVFSFLMSYHHIDFMQALKMLADRLHIVLPQYQSSSGSKKKEEMRERLFTVTKKAFSIYQQFLREDPRAEAARKYIVDRGISEGLRDSFALGYAPSPESAGWNFLTAKLSGAERELAEEVGLVRKNKGGGYFDGFLDRILFPICDEQGRVSGMGGRILGEGQPKYKNSSESAIFTKGHLLLGLYQQQREIRRQRRALVVEGNFDMLSLVEHGCANVVAPQGTALTPYQVRLLKKYADEAILLFDGDSAGIQATVRAVPLFLAEDMATRIVVLPQGHDPDTYIREHGRDALQKLIGSAMELPEFMLQYLMDLHGLSFEGKRKIAQELKSLVEVTSSTVERSVIMAHFAGKLGLSTEQLEAGMQTDVMVPEPVEVQKERKERRSSEKVVLTAAQKRLVEFMVLNPAHFGALDSAGLREVIEGSAGEIIYLQVRALLARESDVQPEDILSALPEGPERRIVSDMLLTIWQKQGTEVGEESICHELAELCEWLAVKKLEIRSRQLDEEIGHAQKENNGEALLAALEEKQKLERELHKQRESV